MASKENSTGGTTRSNGEAARAMSGVGGVRSSDDPVPGLWSGEPAGERRDATCSAVRKRNEELVTAPSGAISAIKVQELQLHAGLAAFGHDARNSESRMRENRPSGLMRGGKQLVIGPRSLKPPLPAYSTPCQPYKGAAASAPVPNGAAKKRCTTREVATWAAASASGLSGVFGWVVPP